MSPIVVSFNRDRAIAPQDVRRLYDLAGWWPERWEEQIAAMLSESAAVGAWDGDHLVGFARAVCDGRFRAYIEDVFVHPDYRGRGIGTALLARLLEALDSIDTVTLFCEPELVPFYERHGFRPRRSQVVMHRQRPRG